MEFTRLRFITLEKLNEFKKHEDNNQVFYRVPINQGLVNTNKIGNDLLKIFKEVIFELDIIETHIQKVRCIKF